MRPERPSVARELLFGDGRRVRSAGGASRAPSRDPFECGVDDPPEHCRVERPLLAQTPGSTPNSRVRNVRQPQRAND
jgi:hypothetical protein